MALSNSVSSLWEIDIDKVIVVNDLEINVFSLVDYIDWDIYEIICKIMDIFIEYIDGCGMMFFSLSQKSFMVRLFWVKGLFVLFDFRKFVEKYSLFIVKDVYGKEWDIIKDDI